MRKSLRIAMPFLVLVLVADVAAAGELDGKTFEISMTDPAGEVQKDTLVFAEGMFDSVGCHEFGFGQAAYTIRKKEGEGVTFSAKTSSETEGNARWHGTVTGDSISGKMKWIKPGQEPITYEFTGKLKS